MISAILFSSPILVSFYSFKHSESGLRFPFFLISGLFFDILKEKIMNEKRICMWKALLFFSVWIGITIPILLSIVFTIFKPLVLADETGISMIVIAAIVAVCNIYVATRIWNRIEDKLYKRKTFM